MKKTLPPLPFRVGFDKLIAGLIFAGTLLIFWFSPLYQVSDSSYSMLLSQSLLEHRSFMLDYYAIPRLPPVEGDLTYKNGPIYQIEWVGNHLYYFLPQGSSVLSVPYVALANAFGVSPANADGTYNAAGEVKIETGLAALLMALTAVIFLLTSRLLLPLGWSVLIALGSTLGTQIWSTASRGLWSHTWATLISAIVVYLLLVAETGKRRFNPILLATLLSWAYFVRPTANVAIIAITVYIFIRYRRLFLPFAVTGAIWLAGFVAYSLHLYGKPLPSYYAANRLTFTVVLPALLGHLVSPSRGLFIYVPVLCFVAYLLIRYRRYVRRWSLVGLALCVMISHLIIISGFVHWWGGFCYGARLTTDLVPWFVLLAILGVEAMLSWRKQQPAISSLLAWNIQMAVGVLLLAASVFINARGAFARETETWNVYPVDVDQKPAKLWSWREPQLLAGLVRPPLPANFPRFEDRIDFSSPESWKYIWYGWSAPERETRWTEGKEATLVFGLDMVSAKTLEIKMAPFLVAKKHNQQRLNLVVNGRQLQNLSLTVNEEQVYKVALPREALQQKNILRLGLPDAVSPKSMKVNDDIRVLGVAVAWMRLEDSAGTK
jgi:hypothetical protein